MEQRAPRKAKPKRRFPWVLFLLLLASVYVFWILPLQIGPRPVHVQFVPDTKAGATKANPR
jgi:hypothetical protein